ncbi:MAG: BamA/TamA family outer membrane protein [candidate division KSB1 bacterium]|nr:BamA/TamA family outer membrane protein [candidate division KSB1 bacterium]MDZ7385779.1 BamA/TamA family outer membrane protein [candidate division KSB1 bacterium]MDZ7392185.1 BamA/TamA family outer membrane protein [candidate division KSB1 bacterium]
MAALRKRYVVPALVCACALIAAASFGQSPPIDSMRVVQIVVSGNHHTRDFVILREMKTKPGDILDPYKLELDRLRVESLGLFTRVEALPVRTDQGLVVVILVSERWYVFPVPILERHEKDWNKFSYGLGLRHMNLRGRNEQAGVAAWWGYNPGYQIVFTSPWLLGKGNTFITFVVSRQRVRNLSPQFPRFEQEVAIFECMFGQRFGYHTYLGVSVGHRQVRVAPARSGATISEDGVDRAPQGGISLSYDTRDLKEYPRQGWWLAFTGRKVGMPGLVVNYFLWEVDARRYQVLSGPLSLALRASGSSSHGKVAAYDRLYLGYSQRIRGHFDQVAEGDSRVLLGAELRFTIVPVRYLNLEPATQLIRDYGRNLKFGINGGLFCDAGSVWFRGSPQPRTWWRGVGAGLHFHLPYGYVLRAEYALDEKLSGEVILDLDVAF